MNSAINVNQDGATRPTWALIAVLAVTLAAETAADIWARWLAPPPAPIDYAACAQFCGGWVGSITRDGCWCDWKRAGDEQRGGAAMLGSNAQL